MFNVVSLRAHQILMLAVIALLLNGCMIGGKFLEEAKDIQSLKNDEVILVGEIQLRPKIRKDEQQINFNSVDVLDIKSKYMNRAILTVDAIPNPKEGAYQIMLNPELEQTFFIKVPKDKKYLVKGQIMLQFVNRVTGMVYSGGQWMRTMETDKSEIILPGNYQLDIRPNDKAVYIGTLRYNRDAFNSITSVKVYNNYKQAAKEFAQRFGTGKVLRQAFVKPVK